ncbi:hypothetical protein DV707_09955 [Halobellus limi]|uniref:Uncharacterized protein n=1 Tax=Halobellus limi TaxID=699433 RepID=A0A4D6H562_9EURY|nr:hypothetical protein DV707_09955 [Halobellus limi]
MHLVSRDRNTDTFDPGRGPPYPSALRRLRSGAAGRTKVMTRDHADIDQDRPRANRRSVDDRRGSVAVRRGR